MKKSILLTLFVGVLSLSLKAQCYELYFTNAAGSPHYGNLTLWPNGTGLLVVQYPNGYGGWNCVEQYVETEKTYMPAYRAYAVCIRGRNPRFCGTSVNNSGYYPDNICLINTRSGWSIVNISGGSISGAWIRQVWC